MDQTLAFAMHTFQNQHLARHDQVHASDIKLIFYFC